MGNSLVRQVTSDISRREFSNAGRILARLDRQTEVGLAKIEAETELQVRRLGAIGFTAKRAMHEVAMVSQLEQQLAGIVPISTSRLQAIGDVMALASAEVVADTYRRVNR
jgi:hypothetical protein